MVLVDIVPDAVGAVFVVTVTAMLWLVVALPSLAVTMMFADPAATPLMLTLEPNTVAFALVASDDDTV